MAQGSPKLPAARGRRAAAILVVAVLAAGAATAWLLGYLRPGGEAVRPAPEAGADRFSLPGVEPSPFRNTASGVGYVGTAACVECHRNQHQSYLRTTHSRSLCVVDASGEPPSGEFQHELSGRGYRAYRDGAALRLREFTRDADGREVVLADHVAGYRLGSGNHSRMYLVKLDDFAVEAPLTWYPREGKWGMSAGYAKDPLQPGFRRAVDAGCLNCHAGRVETIGAAGERVKFSELAIGCERCHGPGALHVQERKAAPIPPGTRDDSIGNLRHLSRDRQEDVCAQCHLSAAADVTVRGRAKGDFRPGLRMSEFAVSFRIDRPDVGMRASGQIDQMRQSRCYTGSKTLTCVTCHDPHGRPAEAERASRHRDTCLSCHKVEACKAPVAARAEKTPADNCVTCHMPRGPTEIPHLTFTHHRIGVHREGPNDRFTEADQLVPVGDVSHLPDHERLRLLGLANGVFASKLAGGLSDETRYDPAHRALSRVFSDRAARVLEGVRADGLRDPDVEEFFSRTYWRKDPGRCVEHADAALRAGRMSPAIRKSVLYHLATSHFDQGRYDQALPYLDELAKCERNEITLMLLGICYQKKGDLPEAVRLVNQAIATSPERADLHEYLAGIYRQMGKAREAEGHTQRAKLLRLKVPQPG